MSSIGMIEHRRHESVTAASGQPTQAFATVEAYGRVGDVAELWSALLPDALATPYQSPAFLTAWTDHVARDAERRPVAVLPLGVRRRFGVSVAQFLGGKHANYNMAAIRRDRVARFTPAEALRLMRAAAAAGGVDAFALMNQPLAWDGVANPLAALPRQPSPDTGYRGPLAPTIDEHLQTYFSAKTRSAQRRKMRRFEEHGAPRLYRAETEAERRLVLDVYFAQKADRLAARGIDNVFEKPGVQAFITAAAGLGGGGKAFDLYGFDVGPHTIATFGAITDGQRLCGMFNSITSCELSRYSPGEMLLNFMVEDAIGRGMTVFDLGVGTASYKAMYCPDPEPLFDSIFGVTAKGRAAAAAVAAKAGAKARVKASPAAYGLVERWRKLRAKGTATKAPGAEAPEAEPPHGDA